jgi:predicted transcriptional regulator
MYKAYLSYEMLGEYLTVLKENGLLDCNEVQEYKTTEKGMRFLKAYRVLGQMAVTI